MAKRLLGSEKIIIFVAINEKIMAKNNKTRIWSEAELIDSFSLKKIKFDAQLLTEWVNVPNLALTELESMIFNKVLGAIRENIEA